MKTKTVTILAVLAASFISQISAAGQYAYRTLSFPLPSGAGVFAGIDGSNIVGSYNDTHHIQHGFLFDGSNYTTLDDPLSGSISELGNGTWATGISGTNIVGYYQNVSGTVHGFLYNGVTWTALDDPLAGSGQGNSASVGTFPFGISNTNVVGYYVDANGATHGFLYDGAAWATLDYPGATSTRATGISAAGVVGSFTDTNSATHGFLFSAGAWTVLNAPASTGTYAEGISGVNVVGYYLDGAGGHNGFLYNGSNWITLNDPLGMSATEANGISGSNIVGNFWTNEYGGQFYLPITRGFLYSAGDYKTLNEPLNSLPTSTVPFGIEGANIVGSFIWAQYPNCDQCSPEPWQGFLDSGGNYSGLADPLAIQVAGGDVDNFLATPVGTLAAGLSGTNIVGYYYDGNYMAHGFLCSGGLWTTLDNPGAGVSSPNNAFRGTFLKGISGPNIVGYFLDTNSATHGFFYNNGAWITLDDPQAQGGGTYATGISDSNIVGYYHSGVAHGFLYNGMWTTLDAPMASGSGSFAGTYAMGVSGSNIVGYYYDTNAVAHGFLYDGNKWTILDDPGARTAIGMGTFAEGISGQNIVGYFVSGGDTQDPIANGFLATPLPAMSIKSFANNITLSWPSNPLATWVLQQNPNLATPGWTPAPGVSNDGTNNFTTLTPSAQNMFFRLLLQ